MIQMEKTRVKKFLKQIRGVSYKPEDLHNKLDDNSVILLRANNIDNGKINFDDVVYVDKGKVSDEQYLKVGDILICASSGSKNLVGKAASVTFKKKCTFGAFCKVVRPNIGNEKYLGVFFQSPTYRRRISEVAIGANINNIRNEHIDDLEIPVYSSDEQANIVEKIYLIQKIIAKRKEELSALDNLIKARFVEMFGNPAVNEKNWEIKDLESVTTIVTYGLTVRPEYIDKGIDLVSAREIHKGYVAYDEAPKISEEDFAKLSEKGKPQKFDILFSKTGSIGHCALVEDDRSFAITQNAARIGLKLDLINPIWLLYYLRMDFIQDWCKGHAKGNAVKDFQLQDMKIIPLFDCPMELQKQFATFVHQVHKSKLPGSILHSYIKDKLHKRGATTWKPISITC